MKTIETTQTIPAQTKTITTYECEHCAFRTQDARKSREHGAIHTYTKTIEMSGLDPKYGYETLYWFETAEAAQAFATAHYHGEKAEWTGPGWYAQKNIEDWRCGDRDDYQILKPLSHFREKHEERFRKTITTLRAIKALARKAA